jgi:sulfoxide reductase heme-binding subunit YedZ
MTYVWLDQFFDWLAMGKDILKRPFITVGVGALALMLPLALTSTDRMQRALGTRRWLTLHRLVYPAAVLAALHFLWLVKRDLREPLVYASILALLFLGRIPVVLARRRRQRSRPGGAAAKARPSARS